MFFARKALSKQRAKDEPEKELSTKVTEVILQTEPRGRNLLRHEERIGWSILCENTTGKSVQLPITK